jgi:Uma2 family endonuclease
MTIAQPQLLLRSQAADWTYERWEQLPDDGNRYEVIGGVLYMTTSPSQFHQWIVVRLVELVGTPARAQGLAFPYIAPLGVLMPGCDPVQPDFFLIRQDRADIIPDQRIRGVPDLIAEVLSPNNAEHDTLVKRGAYARAGVPEYWIVRPATRDVLLCWQPDAELGDYTQTCLISGDAEIVSPTLSVRVAVVDLFSGAPNTAL